MSIDINWETITSGPDGEALAEKIRLFIHDKFQLVKLPGFIRSVQVHSFDFGKIGPRLEIKDIGDPLPDFYDDDDDDVDDRYGEDDDEDEAEAEDENQEARGTDGRVSETYRLPLRRNQAEVPLDYAGDPEQQGNATSRHELPQPRPVRPGHLHTISSTSAARPHPFHNLADHIGTPFPRSSTPGIPGGTSNLSYFHLPLGGLSGTQTPLAAVASGTNFPPPGGWSDFTTNQGHQDNHYHHHHSTTPYAYPTRTDFSSCYPSTRPSTAASLALPPFSSSPTLDQTIQPHLHHQNHQQQQHHHHHHQTPPPDQPPTPAPHTPTHHNNHQQTPSIQTLVHIQYAGDIRLSLTAEILLDYPMPSFVSIPLKLSITGLTFDGIAVLACIGARNLKFCFLAPEDAVGVLEGDGGGGGGSDESDDVEGSGGVDGAKRTEEEGAGMRSNPAGGGGSGSGALLREIRVESEIGRQEGGKQVLKNVGKVERFVLEQIRRIFEDEFVFPSFWTFLL